MFEFPHDPVVVFLGEPLGVARHGFDVGLQVALQQLVHLAVVVVVVANAVHAVDVIPDGSAKR